MGWAAQREQVGVHKARLWGGSGGARVPAARRKLCACATPVSFDPQQGDGRGDLAAPLDAWRRNAALAPRHRAAGRVSIRHCGAGGPSAALVGVRPSCQQAGVASSACRARCCKSGRPAPATATCPASPASLHLFQAVGCAPRRHQRTLLALWCSQSPSRLGWTPQRQRRVPAGAPPVPCRRPSASGTQGC